MKILINAILDEYPDFKEEIIGVTAEEISELEKYCDQPLPEDYKVFLRFMGHDTGRIEAYAKEEVSRGDGTFYISKSPVDISYEAVFKYCYKRKRMDEKRRQKLDRRFHEAGIKNLKDYLLIGINPIGNDAGHFYLDLRSDKLRVVELTETFGEIQRASSFMEFLFADHFHRPLALRLNQLS
ncbi:MAG: SMI1/KNR4 family protein [Spirochaetes bacterium]|nr:SMI1/KNR4 family protein [Spirochaetota bacterium]